MSALLTACPPAYLPAAFDSPTAACAMLDARFALETTPLFAFISKDVWYVTFVGDARGSRL